MSIFYPREKWHLLIREIRNAFRKFEVAKHTERALTFLNHNRGSNIRIVLEFKNDNGINILKKLSEYIKNFLLKNPGKSKSISLPISGYFIDFPTNAIYYNLFNERVLRFGALGTMQTLISDTMLHLFGNTRIYDQSLWAIIIYLNSEIMNAFIPTIKDREAFILSNMEKLPVLKWLQIETEEQEYHDNKINTQLTKNLLTGKLLMKFKKAAFEHLNETGNVGTAYLEIWELIQLHFPKITDQPLPGKQIARKRKPLSGQSKRLPA